MLGPRETSLSALRAEAATVTPWAAICNAISRPIPVEAPVIHTTFHGNGLHQIPMKRLQKARRPVFEPRRCFRSYKADAGRAGSTIG